jgi:hypothetical protein
MRIAILAATEDGGGALEIRGACGCTLDSDLNENNTTYRAGTLCTVYGVPVQAMTCDES